MEKTEEYNHIKTEIGISPIKFNIALTSINSRGGLGELNLFVLKELGYNPSEAEKIDTKKGYYLLNNKRNKPILFIVTVGNGEFSGITLQRNLKLALEANKSFLRSKSVWVPLMGTGAGSLKFVDSYDTTIGVLKNFKDIAFTIAIPDSIKGIEFVKQFRTDNLQNRGNKSAETEGNQKVKDNPVSQTKIVQTGYDKLPEYNIHRLVRDTLNKEYSLNLFIEVSEIRNNFTQKLDLADDENNTYVEVLDRSKFVGVKPVAGFTTGDGTSENEIMFNVFSQVENQVKFLQSTGSEIKNYFAVFSDSFSENNILYARKWFDNKRGFPVTVYTISDIINLATKHGINSDSYLKANTTPFKITEKVEVQIDRESKFLFGLNVGAEIKNYDVIFLPKSSHGGIGQNGIAAHILNLLEKDRNEIEFSSRDLEEIKYKWVTIYTDTKSIEVCFIVSKDIDKSSLDFTDNLKNAIYNFSPAMGSLNIPTEETKIFIPLLGTGQAQLPVADSFNIINEVSTLFKEYFKNPQIRINFPPEIEKEILLNYANVLITFHKLNEVENLNQEIGLLYNEDIQTDSNNLDKTKDKILFHHDNVENVDLLSRLPLAKSFVRLINEAVFDKMESKNSFTVHLDGEWGAGKSTFLNLIRTQLNESNRDWVIVDYNAWQNQHITPPWWALINQIYKQSLKEILWPEKIFLFFKENFRRIVWYSGWQKIISFIFFIFFICVLIYFGGAILNVISNIESEKISGEANGLVIDVFAKLIVGIGSMIGVLYSLSKFLSTPFTLNNAEDAKSFLRRASDPMNRIKRHFNKLVGDLNYMNYHLAVFIDDIDRCNQSSAVNLLEGVQTLFKDKKVLYIIAGDKNWLSTCFEDNYKAFKGKVAHKEGNLGNLFLEKTFQLSLRIPDISDTIKERYWKEEILGIKKDIVKKEILNEADRSVVKGMISDKYMNNSHSTDEIVSDLQTNRNVSYEDATDLVLEALDENKEDATHLLMENHRFIDSNPRSIKRLGNRYVFTRNTLVSEAKNFNREHLFRWLVLEDLKPDLLKHFLDKNKIIIENGYWDKIPNEKQKIEALLFDHDNQHGGALEFQELKDILGY